MDQKLAAFPRHLADIEKSLRTAKRLAFPCRSSIRTDHPPAELGSLEVEHLIGIADADLDTFGFLARQALTVALLNVATIQPHPQLGCPRTRKVLDRFVEIGPFDEQADEVALVVQFAVLFRLREGNRAGRIAGRGKPADACLSGFVVGVVWSGRSPADPVVRSEEHT